jgi:hypothetical protein
MKNVLKAFRIIALVAIIGFSMAACSDDGGGNNNNNNNNSNDNNKVVADAASLYGTWEKISSTDTYWNTIAFGKNEGQDQYLWDSNSTSDAAVSSGNYTVSGSTLKFVQWDGKDSSSGSVTISGNGNTITLSGFGWARLNGTWYKNGASVSSGAVTLESVTANGSSTRTTTELVLIFNERINGLSAADITLSGVAGVTKGTLTGGPKYVLPISGFGAGGTLTVSVAKSGFTISGSPKTVSVYALNWNPSVDVYVVGTSKESSGAYTKATIWKNGVKTLLNTSQSVAKSVYVSGSSVYVAGAVGAWPQLQGKATLWTNGTEKQLNSTNSEASSVCVSGTDVYVAGQLLPSTSLSQRGVYWKNGTQGTNLAAPPYQGSVSPVLHANAIHVSGSNVCVVGYARGVYTDGALWINGTAKSIPSVSNLTSVFVSGNDIYIAGILSSKATLFKTTTSVVNYQQIQNSQSSSANSVYVSGTDIYMAGNEGSNPTLWKGTTTGTSLTSQTLSGSGGGTANSVFAVGADVYVAGYTKDNGATLWINGEARYLDDANSSAYAVFVVKK